MQEVLLDLFQCNIFFDTDVERLFDSISQPFSIRSKDLFPTLTSVWNAHDPSVRHSCSRHKTFAVAMQHTFGLLDSYMHLLNANFRCVEAPAIYLQAIKFKSFVCSVQMSLHEKFHYNRATSSWRVFFFFFLFFRM